MKVELNFNRFNEKVNQSESVDLTHVLGEIIDLLHFFKENPPWFSSSSQTKTEADPLLTLSELAIKLKKSESTLHNWKRGGLIPFQRIGRSIYFSENDVRKALKSISTRKIIK